MKVPAPTHPMADVSREQKPNMPQQDCTTDKVGPVSDALAKLDAAILYEGNVAGGVVPWPLARALLLDAVSGAIASSASSTSEAMKLAEQWKGRADDAGRLSRAVLADTELERESMRLAACGVAALGYHPKEGISSEYQSGSLDDVLKLRELYEELVPLRNILMLCGEEECRNVKGYAEKLRALIDGLIAAKRIPDSMVLVPRVMPADVAEELQGSSHPEDIATAVNHWVTLVNAMVATIPAAPVREKLVIGFRCKGCGKKVSTVFNDDTCILCRDDVKKI